MKKLKYTSIKGLLKIKNQGQITLSEVISKRILHNKKGWSNVYFTPKLYNELENLFKEVIGDFNLKDLKNNYGIYNRLIICAGQNKNYAQYIAGQNYPTELTYLKKLIRSD